MTKIGERLLSFLSKAPDGKDYPQGHSNYSEQSALSLLQRVYPTYQSLVSHSRVIDFGCGVGDQSVALVKECGAQVVGIESNRATLKMAMDNAKEHEISPELLSFVAESTSDMWTLYDVVISQNSFEHFPDPESVLKEMSHLIKTTGVVLITFGPPWFAPYGSHMHFFTKVPWVNILFSEDTVMKVRSRYRDDGAITYEQVESGLNKMTITKFESIISRCDLKPIYIKYDCVKKMNWLSRIPKVRELFINHVTVALVRSTI